LIKILHTSDWHLGKKLYRFTRLEEQRLFLNWLSRTLTEKNIDILVIAGDIFDVPHPPNDAHKLYYDFLEKASSLCEHIIIISGNHDSGDFIKATDSLLKDKNITVFDKLHSKKTDNILELEIRDEKISFTALPYFRNIDLHQYYNHNFKDLDKNETWKVQVINDLFKIHNQEIKNHIAISHHSYGDYSATGSEHTLSLSGIESLNTTVFRDFQYVALGHIHQNQKIKGPSEIYYSGSPIKLRFSEHAKKYCNIVNVESGNVEVQKEVIPVFREIIQIKTDSTNYLSDIKNRITTLKSELTPFIEVKILMHESLTGLAQLIKELCERNRCELLNIIPVLALDNTQEEEEKILNVHELSPNELFQKFYELKYPETEPPKNLQEKFTQLMSEINNEDS